MVDPKKKENAQSVLVSLKHDFIKVKKYDQKKKKKVPIFHYILNATNIPFFLIQTLTDYFYIKMWTLKY